MTQTEIAANSAQVRERIAQAAARAGRSADEITLIAVSKTVSAERIADAYQAGLRQFGENYLQEAIEKIESPTLSLPDLQWHFIGHLQSNKVRDVIRRFAMIHSVDSISLAREIARRSQQQGRRMPILLEVRLDASVTKFGFEPEEIPDAAAQIAPLPGVALCGLMGIPPVVETTEQARPYFRLLRSLLDQLPEGAGQFLSMGMTGDFETAVEEGATHVRIGTAIFGHRTSQGGTR